MEDFSLVSQAQQAPQAPQDLRKVQDLEERISDLESKLEALRNVLFTSRPRIKNLEGTFKVLSATPTTDLTGFEDGSMVFVDNGVSRNIYVFINNAWRSAALT